MTRFDYHGKTYEFDSQACYDGHSMVLLPDGRVLAVKMWLECLPPRPHGFSEVKVVKAQEVVGK